MRPFTSGSPCRHHGRKSRGHTCKSRMYLCSGPSFTLHRAAKCGCTRSFWRSSFHISAGMPPWSPLWNYKQQRQRISGKSDICSRIMCFLSLFLSLSFLLPHLSLLPHICLSSPSSLLSLCSLSLCSLSLYLPLPPLLSPLRHPFDAFYIPFLFLMCTIIEGIVPIWIHQNQYRRTAAPGEDPECFRFN